MSDVTFSNEQLTRYDQIFHNDERPLNPYNNNNLTISQVNISGNTVNINGNTYDICDVSSKNILDEFYDSTNGRINLDGSNNELVYADKNPKILINSSVARGSLQNGITDSDLETIMVLAKDREGVARSWISHVSKQYYDAQGIKMETKRGNVENWFELLINRYEDRVVNLSNPAAWRSAFGFGTDTYQNTASTIITPASNVTIDGAWYTQRCNMAMLRINFHFNTNLSNIPVHGNIGDVVIGTIAAGKRPLVNVHPHSNGEGSGPAWFHLATSGALSLCATEGRGSVYQLNSGTPFYLFVSYIVG